MTDDGGPAIAYAPPRPRRAGEDRESKLGEVRRAIYLLYKRLSPAVVEAYRASIPPGDILVAAGEDPVSGTQRVARNLVAHLRLPRTHIAVAFRPMPAGRAGMVTLGAGPEYRVEVDTRFAARRSDIGAVLAHEVMHVFLERHDLRSEDEILTDTATAYLGTGWPLLNAHRSYRSYSYAYTERLGYLSSEELGYVIGKRAIRFADDPTPWLRTPEARTAFAAGHARAAGDWRRPPLSAADTRERRRYEGERRRARRGVGRGQSRDHDYFFTGRAPLNVTFSCPACAVRITAPVAGILRFRCEVCRTDLDCDT
ncbi:MAG TPA: hypothetical protein VGL93_04195 [Streptosporangiaceae bacterium]